jgi:type IV pilus assembly protein PilE
MKRRAGGFTLIEVMIAVAIVAVLAAVALPAYQEQVRKSRRAEAKSALLQTVQLQERFYTAGVTGKAEYTLDLGPLYGLAASAEVRSGENPGSTDGWYILTADITDCVPAELSGCVRVVATPKDGFKDDNCNVLTLNTRGVRTVVGGQKDNAYCWGG